MKTACMRMTKKQRQQRRRTRRWRLLMYLLSPGSRRSRSDDDHCAATEALDPQRIIINTIVIVIIIDISVINNFIDNCIIDIGVLAGQAITTPSIGSISTRYLCSISIDDDSSIGSHRDRDDFDDDHNDDGDDSRPPTAHRIVEHQRAARMAQSRLRQLCARKHVSGHSLLARD
jgi:hypothetical protein